MSELLKDIEAKAALHKRLNQCLLRRDTDFKPYGNRERDSADCSCGCIFFAPLQSIPTDWGVCSNPDSPRAGLLTWEHQGCPKFTAEEDK